MALSATRVSRKLRIHQAQGHQKLDNRQKNAAWNKVTTVSLLFHSLYVNAPVPSQT